MYKYHCYRVKASRIQFGNKLERENINIMYHQNFCENVLFFIITNHEVGMLFKVIIIV